MVDNNDKFLSCHINGIMTIKGCCKVWKSLSLHVTGRWDKEEKPNRNLPESAPITDPSYHVLAFSLAKGGTGWARDKEAGSTT